MTVPIPGLVTAHDLVEAVRSTLLTHLPPVLEALNAAYGTRLTLPASHAAPTAEALKRGTVACPVMVVSTAGMEGEDGLVLEEDGRFVACWAVLVQFLVRSDEGTYEATQRDVHLYAAAIRTVLVERGDLDGFARRVQAVTESDYATGDPEDTRTLGEGAVYCEVYVPDVARTRVRFTAPAVEGVAASTEITVLPAGD